MPNKQKQAHMLTEWLGVLSGGLLIWIGTQTPGFATILYVIGGTTLVVDLYFLRKWGAI